MPIDPKRAAKAIASVRKDLKALDEDTFGAVMGVSHALNDTMKALEDVDECLYDRQFEKAAALGYDSVSSGFVFLQRTLAGLNDVESSKALIIQDLARKLKCSYEDVLPHVDAALESMLPPPLATLETAAASRAFMSEMRSSLQAGKPLGKKMRRRTAPAPVNVERSTGLGSIGSRKANALLDAVKRGSKGASHTAVELPPKAWAEIDRESKRLGVTGAQLIEAAITNWVATNPKKARGKK